MGDVVRLFPSLMILIASVAMAADAPLPWYMRETAMTPEGRLTFLDKPWWPRAKALAEGESFTLDLNGDGRPDTLIIRKDGHIIEAIDDTGKAADIWNQSNTCYVVSLKGTGLVDRLIAYIDNNGDGKADEMELRHYRDGYLRYAWIGENYDNDGLPVFDIKNWSYSGDGFKSKFRGNVLFYLNKYDAATRTWTPLSECPFSFWDEDKDGHGETVLRVSAAPLASLTGPDSDYANNYNYMWAPETTPLRDMGNLNVRYSFNIDPLPRREDVSKPHYNFGFTSVGSVPYRYDRMTYLNSRRRPPQTVTRINWADGRRVAMTYPAKETGFTWDEARSVWRWEGQFWIYERVYLSNTGAPTERWNMRREFAPKPSSERQIYFSEVDQRYHMLGATEGWLEAGHLVNPQKDLEFRWYDKDGDGFFDTIAVFEGNSVVPARLSHFAPRARKTPLDRVSMQKEYNQTVLPRAIADDERMIAALKKLAASPVAAAYEAEAAKADMAERRRYCLDIARELYFLKVRDMLRARAVGMTYPGLPLNKPKYRSTEPGTPETGYSMGDSLKYWQLLRGIESFSDAYGAGQYNEALAALAELTK